MNSATDTASTTPPLPVPAAQPARSRRHRAGHAIAAARPILLAVLAVGALAWCAHTAWGLYHYETTDDAYVVGHLHQISSQIDGQVQEVLVHDNQIVRAGDVLLRLDPLEFQIALQKAEAGVAEAHAQATQAEAAVHQTDAALAEAHARVTQGEAQLAQAEAQLTLAKLTLARNDQLFAHGGAVTQADVDTARSGSLAAQANRDAAQAAIAAAHAAVGSAEANQAASRAQAAAAGANVGVAEAARSDAARLLAQATVVAPAAGRIGNKHIEPGNRVLAGQALLALVEPDTWIIANFKETQLAHMNPGQQVELKIDALPGTDIHGTLESLSPASGAQFALLPPDNSTGNFNKVVQRVPVKILLDDASRAAVGDRLRVGLSVEVGVRVR